MNIDKYNAFLRTVELSSLTKAAETLGYTQSGISHIINSIEQELELTLLIRDRAGVRLTSEGEFLLPLIQKICLANQDLEKSVKSLRGLEAGLIRIGGFSSVTVHWLPAVIKSFREVHPNIDFEIIPGNYTEIERWIKEGKIDFGFLKLPVNKELESIYLGQDKLVVILPEEHPLSTASSFPIEQLTKENFILLEEGPENEITNIFELHKIKPNIRFVARDDYSIMAMVESGLGISILPELILHRTPYNIVVKELEIPTYRKLAIALRNSEYASLATKQFLKYIHNSNFDLFA